MTRAGQYFHVGTVCNAESIPLGFSLCSPVPSTNQIPDRNSQIYCADIRMMIHYDHTIGAFRPLALYSRRAHKPLKNQLEEGEDSWGMLGTTSGSLIRPHADIPSSPPPFPPFHNNEGTNLSVKVGPNEWTTETNRLFLMDTRDFNKLGLGTDDLIDAFFQTVMATIAIDRLAIQLMKDPATFNRELFRSLNKDEVLMKELFIPPWEQD